MNIIKRIVPIIVSSVFLFANLAHATDFSTVIGPKELTSDGRRLVLKSVYDTQSKLYTFERCTESNKNKTKVYSSCKKIGSAEGYSKAQIVKRANELHDEKNEEAFYDVAKVSLGVVAGAVAGFTVAATLPKSVYGSGPDGAANMFGAIMLLTPTGAIGGGAIALYFVWGSEKSAQIEMLEATQQAKPADRVVYIDLENNQMDEAIKQLNITLAGIY